MNFTMPTIDLARSGLTGRDLEIAQDCLAHGVRLRANFPSLKGAEREQRGEARYVWRMVAFQVSPNHQHQCMPMTAEFDLPKRYWPTRWEMGTIVKDGKRYYVHCYRDAEGKLKTVGKERREADARQAHDARRLRVKELETVIDAIVNCVPPSQWYGVKRWGRALGAL